MRNSANCWPTSEQYLLLQAGLSGTPKARAAWDNYCQLTDFQKIEHIATTFFPLVYQNFKHSYSTEFKSCKSVYRHTWSYNHLQFFKLRKILTLLKEASIKPCLLKGAALIAYYYQDAGLRVMGDINILISREQVKTALLLLRKAGWRFKTENLTEQEIDEWIDRTHAFSLIDSEGVILDLHWALLSENGLDPIYAGYTYRTSEISSSLLQTITILSPEDQLIHTLFHGLKYSPQPFIRWIPDAVMILRKTPHFEWNYFLCQAKYLKIKWMIYTAVRYLHTHSFAEIPSAILATIDQYIPSKPELNHFRFITQKPLKLLSIFQMYWYCHARNFPSSNPLILLWNLPSFLKKARKISNWHKIPFFFIPGNMDLFKKRLHKILTNRT